MTGRIRKMASLILVLALTLTAQSMAVARGAAGPAGEVVLCTGQGAVSIQVDENGQPVGPAHICPDCALSFFNAVALAPVLVARPLTAVTHLAFVAVLQGESREEPVARARAPPATV